MKCLLTIQLFKFTGDEIGVMRIKQPNDRYLDDILPEWCVKDDGTITQSDGWLQFVNEGKEFYYGFNVIMDEGWLAREIEAMGLGEVSEAYGLDFSFLKDICRYGYEDTFHSSPGFEHIVFSVTYSGGGYGEDVDCDIYIDGYLDTEKRFVELK